MPDSSYVHSYLGKILEERGDERAIAEYATAVHLDPTNQDALRSYAGYFLSRQDYRGALRFSGISSSWQKNLAMYRT